MDRFAAARIGAPFGVKGQVKAISLSGEIAHLEKLPAAILRLDGVDRLYEIESSGGSPQSFFLKFKGVETPEAAAMLHGAELMLDRADAAPLAAGEYYIEDLRGFSVVLDGRPIGVVNDIVEGGGGQLVDVRLDSGESRMVPFRDEFFGEVDTAARRLPLLMAWILE